MLQDALATISITAMEAAITGVTGAISVQWYKKHRSERDDEQ